MTAIDEGCTKENYRRLANNLCVASCKNVFFTAHWSFPRRLLFYSYKMQIDVAIIDRVFLHGIKYLRHAKYGET